MEKQGRILQQLGMKWFVPLFCSSALDGVSAFGHCRCRRFPRSFFQRKIFFPPVLGPFLTIPGKHQGLTSSPWALSSLEAQPAAALVLPGNLGFEDAL